MRFGALQRDSGISATVGPPCAKQGPSGIAKGEKKMNLLVPFYVMLASTAATSSPVAVQTADGDWSRLPSLEARGYDHLSSDYMTKLHQIASEGQCRLPGYDGNRLDMRLSFAAQYDAGGSLQRIVLPKLHCPEAEGVIGGALLDMMRGGDYRPTGKNPEGWYRGNFAFSFVAE